LIINSDLIRLLTGRQVGIERDYHLPAGRQVNFSHERARDRPSPAGCDAGRILEVALELFNEQGYDKTSLREIAERLPA
jgi:hypothetical protein